MAKGTVLLGTLFCIAWWISLTFVEVVSSVARPALTFATALAYVAFQCHALTVFTATARDAREEARRDPSSLSTTTAARALPSPAASARRLLPSPPPAAATIVVTTAISRCTWTNPSYTHPPPIAAFAIISPLDTYQDGCVGRRETSSALDARPAGRALPFDSVCVCPLSSEGRLSCVVHGRWYICTVS